MAAPEPHEVTEFLSTSSDPSVFLEKVVPFKEESLSFERRDVLTDFRKDPGEARVLYECRRWKSDTPTTVHDNGNGPEDAIMKIKVQWPGPHNLIHEDLSPTTSREIQALQTFRDAGISNVPHLLAWKRTIQSSAGIYPDGYIVYVIMTKMPGRTLWDLGYWSLPSKEREYIQDAFMRKLKELRALGIAPYDCALRNILWDQDSRQCSIIDFEHYHKTTVPIADETVELQNWGLVSRPPPAHWAIEWGVIR